jgi:UDP-2,4-diacetamido-2,4,6-trideoxy-beta-L-altropyranose hydrolase
MRTLIFTEGGSISGFGHISRCSSLYDELAIRGINVEFIIFGDSNPLEIIKEKKYKVANWLSANFLKEYIKEDDLCIVDSYLVNEDLLNVISTLAAKTLYIDDNGIVTYPRGIVVNPALSTANISYKKSEENNYLLGPQYIILRPPFVQAKREGVRSVVKEILITLGGSDTRSLIPLIIHEISSNYSNFIFNVVSSTPLKCAVEKNSNCSKINFFENITAEEMKKIMLKSDVAIAAAGQTTYELMATQTPFIPIMIVDNQINNLSGLEQFNLIQNVIDSNEPDFLKKLLVDFERILQLEKRQELIIKYSNLVDGLGSKRIIDFLLINSDCVETKYFLRKVNEEDIKEVFKLSNEDYVREYSLNSKKINWEEHLTWFKNIINSNTHVFYVVTDSTNKFLGQIRYRINDKSATVSISFCKPLVGKGLSKGLLKQSIEMVFKEISELENIIAFVSVDNFASKRLFENTGFVSSTVENRIIKYLFRKNNGE